MHRSIRIAAALAAAVALAATFHVTAKAVATPLDPDECARLENEEALLTKAGARDDFARGPKANLTAARIEQVRKLIAVEEAISFRCGKPKPLPAEAVKFVPTPPPGAAAAAVLAKPKVRAKAAAKSPDGNEAVEHQPAAPKPKPKPTVAKAPEGTASGELPAAAPPKPKPKPAAPKAPDAYAPPAKAPN